MQSLKPPIYVIPAFQTYGNHVALAEKIGLVVGSLAREKQNGSPEYFLVQVPRGWTDTHDEFGQYLVDEENRRRIRFGNLNRRWSPESELLTRFSIQEWWLGDDWLVYVRKIVGGEDNVYHYGKCHHLAGTSIQLPAAKHHSREGSPGFASCEKWLGAEYPDWRNPLAYWDIP